MKILSVKKMTPLMWLGYTLFLLINIGIASWYLLASAWALGEMRIEVLTGAPYEWPLRVRLVSLLLAISSITIIASTIFLRFSKWCGRLLIACIILLALLELLESVALGLSYGFDLMLVQAPALLSIWAIATVFYVRRREA
jgi:hypothetical protein